MPAPSWANENANRAYPLLAADSRPPDGVLVDAGFAVGPKSRFESGVHGIALTAIRRRGTFFYLDFSSDAPELFDVPLTFTRQTTDDEYAVEFVDSGTAGFSTSSDSLSSSASRGLCDEPLWSGFVVTGKVAVLEALLPADGDLFYAARVEPALTQNLAESYVVKLGVANGDRTRSTPPDGCDVVEASDEVTITNAYCVVGEVRVVPGYNATVRQSQTDNSITIGAAVGAGEGEPCQPVPLFAGEADAVSSTLLEGGLRCNETLRSINGAGGPQLTITAGPGVSIVSDPEGHRLTIGVTMRGLAVCYGLSSRSESC